MVPEFVSKKTRNEFALHFVRESTLRRITEEFDAADVPFDADYIYPGSGERRALVEQYYHAVEWTKWADVQKVLVVYTNVLAGLEARFRGKESTWEPEYVKEISEKRFESLKKWIERDGYRYESGELIAVGKGVDLADLSDTATRFDIPELQKQIERAQHSIEDDPAQAIGTAKEMVETTCKTILTERGIPYSHDENLPSLVKLTREALNLLPDNVPNSVKGAESVKKILGSLGAVAQGIAELRSLFGTGHGREGKAKGLTPRHARLAVGSAATLSMFLLETHEERKNQ